MTRELLNKSRAVFKHWLTSLKDLKCTNPPFRALLLGHSTHPAVKDVVHVCVCECRWYARQPLSSLNMPAAMHLTVLVSLFVVTVCAGKSTFYPLNFCQTCLRICLNVMLKSYEDAKLCKIGHLLQWEGGSVAFIRGSPRQVLRSQYARKKTLCLIENSFNTWNSEGEQKGWTTRSHVGNTETSIFKQYIHVCGWKRQVNFVFLSSVW